MAKELLCALYAAIDGVDGLANLGVTVMTTWVHHTKTQVYSNIGHLPNDHTAHQSMAYALAKAKLAPTLEAISIPMEGMPSVARAAFQWDISTQRAGGTLKTKVTVNGIHLATGGTTLLRKAVSKLVCVLDKLPAHEGRLYLVDGVRLPAADPASALLLWAALHQRGNPTPDGTRALLTGPKRPETLHVIDLDTALVQGIVERI